MSVDVVHSVPSVTNFGSSMKLISKRNLVYGTILMIGMCYIALKSSNLEIVQFGDTQQVDLNQQISPTPEARQPKILLFWTKYYNADNFYFGLGQEPFIRAGCPVSNCIATSDRQLLNQSAGILFHGPQYNASDIPGHRLPHQRYIFLIYETLPGSKGRHFFQPRHFFNWTMSHRRDSDIYDPRPYGIIKTKEQPEQLPPLLDNQKLEPSQSLLEHHSFSQLANRTKLVAWFCSNQFTNGQREVYFRELSKYLQLDIYGRCGNLTCPPTGGGDNCNHLLSKYKFYIAAENSLCPDYVSEKFYRALSSGVIPIVYGGADYTQFAPPHSYIHIKDFDSPKHLADYILLLDSNPELYMAYFWWTPHYTIVSSPNIGWCKLCEMLNDPTLPAKSYESVGDFWYDQAPCLDGKTFVGWKLSNSTKQSP